MTSVDHEQQHAHDLIAQIIRETGLTASEIARKAGLAPSTLTRIYPAPTVEHTLSARTLAKIRSTFPATGRDHRQIEASIPVSEPIGLELHLMNPFHSASLPASYEGLEIFETAKSHASAPEQILLSLNPKRYFAAYMPGTSMSPRIKAGEALIADTVRPPALQCDVMVFLKTDLKEGLICIGILVDRDANSITLKNFQTEKLYRVALADISASYPIVAIVSPSICL